MLNFLRSNELFLRIGRLACLIVPAAMILWRMYSYLDTHTIDGHYALTPVMCGLTALFLALAGIAWSFRPDERVGD